MSTLSKLRDEVRAVVRTEGQSYAETSVCIGNFSLPPISLSLSLPLLCLANGCFRDLFLAHYHIHLSLAGIPATTALNHQYEEMKDLKQYPLNK